MRCDERLPMPPPLRGTACGFDWPDRWVQVRASNTEPILRVIAEAPDAESARKLSQSAMQAVRAAVRCRDCGLLIADCVLIQPSM